MTPAEATKILDLLPHAAREQIEERFIEQRTLLEDKAARALTPKLQGQYREALARITEAYETLVLAEESITLPSLKPHGGPAAEARPPEARRPSSVTEAAAAAAVVDSFGPFVMRHLGGIIRGVLAIIAGSVVTSAVEVALGEHVFSLPLAVGKWEFLAGVWILVAALPGLAWWIYLVRATRRASLQKLRPGGTIQPEHRHRPAFFTLLTSAVTVAAWIYIQLDNQEREVAKEWNDRGHSNENKGRWTDAVAAYGQARGLRPNHEGYRRDHDLAQQWWIDGLSGELKALPPEQAYAQLTREAVRPKLWLTSPTRERYHKLFELTTARARETTVKKLETAGQMVGEGKLPEARAVIEKLGPMARMMTEFQAAVDRLEEAEFDLLLMPVHEAQTQDDFPKAYALLEKLPVKDESGRRRLRVAVVKMHISHLLHYYHESSALIARGEFVEAQDKFTDMEVMVERISHLEGYATAIKSFDGLDLAAMISEVRRGWRAELMRRTTAELVEALATSDASRAQDILAGYASLQGYATPVAGEALVKEKFFPQFVDYLAILNLRTVVPGEPDSLSCLALVQAALPHFTNPEPARKFLAEGYYTLAQWGLKNGMPGLALYLQRESVRAGGATDEAMEAAALKLFAENNAVTFAFPEIAYEGENSTALAENLYQATKTALETASRGMLVLTNDGSVDEDSPRQFVLKGVLTGIDTTRNQRTEKRTASYQSGSKQVPNPAYRDREEQAKKSGQFYYLGRTAVIEAQSQLNFAIEHGRNEAVPKAKENLAIAEVNSLAQRKAWDAQLAELQKIPATVQQPVLVEEPYEQVISALNHVAGLTLTLKHGALPDGSKGLATWEANLRYSTVEITGDIQRGVPVQEAVFVDDAGVSRWLEADLKAKITAQAPALLWQLVRAVRAAKEKQLQLDSSRVRLSGEFEWGWVTFWEKCGVPMQTGAAEAAAREDLGLPAVAVTAEAAFAPPAGLVAENSVGMLFTSIPGTKVLFSLWETRVQDFAAFSNETGYAATGDMRSLTASGWEVKGDTWRNPGFPQFPVRPVSGVSWHDAKAFCAWLTKKERAAGLMASDREYRLPTAAEWILAAKESPSDTPAVWPRLGAGNLAGSEVTSLPWPKEFKILSDYRDGFARTATVGWFSANALGIYDLEGNVAEWCQPEGQAMAGIPVPVLGSSFVTAESETGGKEPRQAKAMPELRVSNVGFRVVIAPVENK